MTKAAELAKMGEVLTNSQIGGRRNMVINGAMQVAQRGTSFTGVGNGDNAYYLDRFKFAEAGSPNGEFTITQASDGPNGFANSMKFDCTTAETALAANEAIRLIYNFEGQDLQHLKKGTSNAEYVTLSFYVKSNLTGTAVVGLYDNDNTRYNAKSYTIDSANTWERKVLTYQPDTTGTLDDDNALSLQIYFWLQAGSNKTSGTLPSNWESNTEANQAVGQTINIASSTDNDFFITGVQLEVGSVATSFEHRSYAEQLELCKRYFQKFGGGANKTIAHVYSPSTSELALDLRFAPEMRTSPSVDWSSDTTDMTYRYSGDNSQNFDRGNLNNDGGIGQLTPQGGSMWIQGWSHGQSTNGAGEIRTLSVTPEEFIFVHFDAEL
jgi:hypothetical protein